MSTCVIQFQGHWGTKESNSYCFYNVTFVDICSAATHLKNLPPGPNYEGYIENDQLYFKIKEYQQNEFTMEVSRLSPYVSLPKRSSEGAAGYNICSSESTTIYAGNRGLVCTGLSIKMPPGLYGRIASCSGVAIYHGVEVGAGVIDADNQSEIKVLLFNHSHNPFEINVGDRIAQLILERYETPVIKEVYNIHNG